MQLNDKRYVCMDGLVYVDPTYNKFMADVINAAYDSDVHVDDVLSDDDFVRWLLQKNANLKNARLADLNNDMMVCPTCGGEGCG